MTEESRKKMSEALRKRPFNAEANRKIGLTLMGHPVSEATREKLRGRLKGRKLSNETRKKMSDSRKGRVVSLETRRKIGNANRGEKSANWQGGKTSQNALIRQSIEYKLWREAVYKRDNYTCIWCGNNNGNKLNADHIKPFAYFPELRFALDNGRTLCKNCHQKTDTYGWKAFHKLKKVT